MLEKNKSCLILVDVQEKLTPFVLQSQLLVNRCHWLLKLAMDLQVPSLVSEQYPKGLGHTVEALKDIPATEKTIEKVHFSAYREPKFVQAWQEQGRKQAILIGIETHVCVQQTALDMHEDGIEVFIVVDAVSSRHEMDHKYALKRMKQAGIQLVTSEMVFFEWLEKAGTPEFKALSQAYLPRSKNRSL